ELVSNLGDHITDARSGVDRDFLTCSIAVHTPITGPAGARYLFETAPVQPVRKVELFPVLTVRMNPHLVGILSSQEVHGVRHHHCPFVKVLLKLSRGFPDPIWWRHKLCNKVVEVHCTILSVVTVPDRNEARQMSAC